MVTVTLGQDHAESRSRCKIEKRYVFCPQYGTEVFALILNCLKKELVIYKGFESLSSRTLKNLRLYMKLGDLQS